MHVFDFTDQCFANFIRRQRQCERDGGNGMQLDGQQCGGLDHHHGRQQRQRQWNGQLFGCGEYQHQFTAGHDDGCGTDLHGESSWI